MTIKEQAKAQRLQSVPRKAWSVAEVAASTGLSYAGIRREIAAGHLVTVKMRRRTLILDEDFRIWLASLPKVG